MTRDSRTQVAHRNLDVIVFSHQLVTFPILGESHFLMCNGAAAVSATAFHDPYTVSRGLSRR